MYCRRSVIAAIRISLALCAFHSFARRSPCFGRTSRRFFALLLMAHVVAQYVGERSGRFGSGLGHDVLQGGGFNRSACGTPWFPIVDLQERLSCRKLLAQSLPRQ